MHVFFFLCVTGVVRSLHLSLAVSFALSHMLRRALLFLAQSVIRTLVVLIKLYSLERFAGCTDSSVIEACVCIFVCL